MVPAVANSIISRAYSTPVGTIISLYGKTAPAGYLACDGATYNRDDYPDLAEYLVSQFEDLVGDGETTFKVPDLQGEFLRGTGTNSYENQGSGANVGVHQDGTQIPWVYSGSSIATLPNNIPQEADFVGTVASTNYINTGSISKYSTTNKYYISRPTNTSVLYCIKY